MLNKDWKQFKSGTDIRGVASEGVTGQAVNLTDGVIEKMASGFALWLSSRTGKDCGALHVAVGHDSRISADRISAAVIRALTGAGIRVSDCGLASTPSMFMTTIDLSGDETSQCDGAIQITASHHPFNRNGLKFFTKDGGLDGPDIEAILQHAQDGDEPAKQEGGCCQPLNYMKTYSSHLREMIKKGVNSPDYNQPLKGFKIVVDAGNGAGGFYAADVLAPLGADTNGSQFLDPDGMFPNHIPNPENETAMRSVCDATLKAGADLGVIFDTDVDRGGAVDAQGVEINRNRLVAIASSIALEGNQGGTIVTDSITSSGLKLFLENTLGGVHHRFQRGYKNVINEALRLNKEGINCPLAIETSGHAALRENYFLDDGAYLVTKIIIKMAVLRKENKSLESLLEALAEPAEAMEIRLPLTEENFRACGEKILSDLEYYAKEHHWDIAPDNREGLRVSFPKNSGDGWFLLRLSVHDPIMPLNIESDTPGGVLEILRQLYEFLADCQGINLEPAIKALGKT